MKVTSESEVAQLCPTLSDPMDCSLPGFSVHGIFQARVLKLTLDQVNLNNIQVHEAKRSSHHLNAKETFSKTHYNQIVENQRIKNSKAGEKRKNPH